MALRVAERILDLIGRPPLLRLVRWNPPAAPDPDGLEYLNPGGSVKHPAASLPK